MRLLLILAGFLTPVVAGQTLAAPPPGSGWVPGLKAVFDGSAPSLALLLIALEVDQAQVRGIRVIGNPDKLRRV